MYHELIYHLDLCMFSYHLHAQTLIWPTDPYLEWAVDREEFCKRTEKHFSGKRDYHGPGSTQGWSVNKLLDPVMSRYSRLNPWQPVFLYPEKSWLWHNTPSAITKRIAEVHMSRYQPDGDPNRVRTSVVTQLIRQRSAGTGNDLLYCFEGGTGSVSDSPANWSVMGFVLARDTPGGGYVVHIAFRGSRSGSALRAARSGLTTGNRVKFGLHARDTDGVKHRVTPFSSSARHVARGNSDWVTDMDFNATVKDPVISAEGSACRGFSIAVKTCIPTIIQALRAIHQAKGRPSRITVTGHSLGGALAAQFSAAMVIGSEYGPNGSRLGRLVPGLDQWPWDRLRLITMSAPVVGGNTFHDTFNQKIDAVRIQLGGDPITQERRHYHVGKHQFLMTTNDTQGGIGSFKHHEPFNVRRALISRGEHWGEVLTAVPAPHVRENPNEPWKVYGTFAELYANPAFAEHLGGMLNCFAEEFCHYLAILSAVVGSEKRRKILDAEALLTTVSLYDRAREQHTMSYLEKLARTLDGIVEGSRVPWNHEDTEFNKFLGLSVVLAAMSRGAQFRTEILTKALSSGVLKGI